jgi:hypothetical protein
VIEWQTSVRTPICLHHSLQISRRSMARRF